jgi:hypothetical protein
MVAGILGGSGTHVVQIIIGIVVAAVMSASLQRLSANVTATQTAHIMRKLRATRR